MNEKQIEKFRKSQELIEQAGKENDPLFKDYLAWIQSPLAKGKHADKFASIIEKRLAPRIAQQELFGHHQHPNLKNSEKICIGYEKHSNTPCHVSPESLTQNILTLGELGTGKTTFFCWLIDQLIQKGVQFIMLDHKNESRRLLNRQNVLIVRPHQLWFNVLQPVGDSKAYYAALAQELAAIFQLHAATTMKITSLLLQLETGLQENEPYPSLHDFKRVLQKQRKQTNDKSLQTAANAIHSLSEVFGKASKLRKSPHDFLDLDYPVLALETQNLPPRIVRFISAVFLIRLQLSKREHGHGNTGLEHVYFSDEATIEFFPQSVNPNTATYIPPSRKLFTQIRSSRTGIFAGVQSLKQTDTVVKTNAATFVCLHAQDYEEQREAARLLRLPIEESQKLARLQKGEGYFRSPLYKQPVHFTFPNYGLGEYMSDAQVASLMESKWNELEKDCVYSPHEEQQSGLSYTEILGEKEPEQEEVHSETKPAPVVPMQDWLLLLGVIKDEPMAVAALYKKLRWSAGKGSKIKSALLGHGFIRTGQSKPTGGKGGRPRMLLEITEQGNEYLSAFSG